MASLRGIELQGAVSIFTNIQTDLTRRRGNPMNIRLVSGRHSIWPLGAAVLSVAATAMVGCSSLAVPASPSEHARAAQLPVYMAQEGGVAAKVRADLGPVEGYGCNPQRDLPKDVNAQRSDALDQLRLRALKAGADGVIDVRFSPIQTDRRNACFQGMAARGEAVAFNGASGF
jgi:hypothetical protein